MIKNILLIHTFKEYYNTFSNTDQNSKHSMKEKTIYNTAGPETLNKSPSEDNINPVYCDQSTACEPHPARN